MRFQAIKVVVLPGNRVIQPNFCSELRGSSIAGTDPVSVLFSDLHRDCFAQPAEPEYFDEVMIAFEWQINGVPGNPKAFDFCISDLEAIPLEVEDSETSE